MGNELSKGRQAAFESALPYRTMFGCGFLMCKNSRSDMSGSVALPRYQNDSESKRALLYAHSFWARVPSVPYTRMTWLLNTCLNGPICATRSFVAAFQRL